MNTPSQARPADAMRIVVIGGSLGGLLAGNLLYRAGHDVTVHERIDEELFERGLGIATHPELHAAFERIGIAVDETFGVPIHDRVAMGTDGSILARYELSQLQATWGQLYRSLLGAFPRARYCMGSNFERVELRKDGACVIFDDGSKIDADLLVGADGSRSAIRAQLWPDVTLQYAGYVAWRGAVDEELISEETRSILFTRFNVCLPAGEHIVGYPVAGLDGDVSPGKRRFNFVWYRPVSATQLKRMMTDATGHYHEAGIPPHLIDPKTIAETRAAAAGRLPPAFAELLRVVKQPFFQTIADLEMPNLVKGRVVMMGDAAFTARPHLGMGVIKAVGDAVMLTEVLEAFPGDLEHALMVYDAERTRYGRYLVQRGRQLGTQIGVSTRTDEELELGAYIRRPENVIRAISMPPSSSPLPVLNE